jgi:O-antigen ligase
MFESTRIGHEPSLSTGSGSIPVRKTLPEPKALHRLRVELPLLGQVGVGLLVIVLLLFSLREDISPLIVVAGIVGIALGFKAMTDGYLALMLYIVSTVALFFRPKDLHTKPHAGILEVVVGLAMTCIAAVWFVRVKMLERNSQLPEVPQILFNAYFGWSIVLGALGIALFNNTVNDWYREILIQLPLFIVPLLYAAAVKPRSQQERILFAIVVLSWSAVLIQSLIRFREGIIRAVYMYQTGRTGVDPTFALFLFFITISLVLIEKKKSRQKYYLLPAGLAFINIGLGLYRTVWVIAILMIPILFLLAKREERKRGYRFLGMLGIAAVIGVIVAMRTSHVANLYLTSMFVRLTTTTKVTTDSSLKNRYIEWSRILIYIRASPLVGYGYGAHFLNFDWLRGFYSMEGYTHNGYLMIFFKSGLIGFIAFFAAYFGFLMKAFRIVRSRFLTEMERGIARAAIAFMFSILILSTTLNSFAERISMVWLALAWSFVTVYDRVHKKGVPVSEGSSVGASSDGASSDGASSDGASSDLAASANFEGVSHS